MSTLKFYKYSPLAVLVKQKMNKSMYNGSGTGMRKTCVTTLSLLLVQLCIMTIVMWQQDKREGNCRVYDISEMFLVT